MARRTGRGLFLGKEDFIPLERVDILDDLKRFVDVHRLTDFTLSDKIIPTIELRRTEDEIIGAVGILAVGGIGRTTAQLFGEGAATGLGIVARPLSVVVTTEAVDNVYFGYLPFSGGAVVSISADPRGPGECRIRARDQTAGAHGRIDHDHLQNLRRPLYVAPRYERAEMGAGRRSGRRLGKNRAALPGPQVAGGR